MKISLLITALFVLAACTQNTVEQEYNSHLLKFSAFLEEQDNFGKKINESFFDPELHNQEVEEYLAYLDRNREELEEFKVFIESNYEQLEDLNKNPVLIRDLIKIILENNQADESFFQRCNAIFERYNQ